MALFYEPWVGKSYRSQATKLLILGESHYGEAAESEQCTVDLTNQYISGKLKHAFWTNIMQVVTGLSHIQTDATKFWHSVAFSNYIQCRVGEGANIAPTSEMWRRSEQVFPELLEKVSPDRVLVLSTRLWVNIPGPGRAGPPLKFEEKKRDTWLFPVAGGEALATWIPHPSRAFSWKRWHPLVQELLK